MPVYFMQATDGGPVKIGHSVDVDSRRAQLETHYGKPLALLGTLPGGRDEERDVHDRFAHLRLGRTEQFRPASELMAFIGWPLLVGPNPDAVEAMDAVADRKPMVVQVRGSKDWKTWLEGLADREGDTLAKFVERMARKWAKDIGYGDPPKR